MYGMKKTTVYLPDALKARLEELSAETNISEAEAIRAALAEYLDRGRPRPRAPLFDSGRGDLAEHVDEALRGFGER